MANTNAPYGLRPLRTLSGQTSFSPRTIIKGIASGDTQACYKGDMLKLLNTGYVAQWSATTAVSQFAGVFWGCRYVSVSQGKQVYNNIWPGSDASGDVDVFMIPATGTEPMLFQIQANVTGVVLADRGANFDITVGSGSTTTGLSASVLDVSTLNTTATLPLRLIELWSDDSIAGTPGSAAGAYNWAVVMANVSGAGATGI
jgi:hypothetical protein